MWVYCLAGNDRAVEVLGLSLELQYLIHEIISSNESVDLFSHANGLKPLKFLSQASALSD